MSVAVLRKELVEVTGDPISALILNQMIFCAERCSRAGGWFYKASGDLASELMGLASAATVRRRIRDMVDKGLIEECRDMGHSWDRTIWYRVTEKLKGLKKFAFRRHDSSIDHSDASSDHGGVSLTKSSLECSTALQSRSAETVRAVALTVFADANTTPTNQQAHARAHAQTPAALAPPASQAPALPASQATLPPPASQAAVYDKSAKRKGLENLQKIVQVLAASKGKVYESEVKPLPRSPEKLDSAVEEIGGHDSAESFLNWAFTKDRCYLANFKWKDFDIYLLLCKGLIKQWRIDSGEVRASGQVGFRDLLAKRLRLDEYDDNDVDDKGVGW